MLPPPVAALRSWGVILVLIAGCGHAKESHAVVRHWDAELAGRLGTASKSDIQALMGEPTARDLIGDSEAWVYQYGKDDRDIRPEYKAVAPKHDELLLNFNPQGILQHYTVVIEGRSTQRSRTR